jgi:hypothetical protein
MRPWNRRGIYLEAGACAILGFRDAEKECDAMNRSRPRRPPYARRQAPSAEEGNKQFDELEASSLYCPKCKTAVPLRKRLLLVLPEGERYEYLCAHCSTSVGRKMKEATNKIQLIHTA